MLAGSIRLAGWHLRGAQARGVLREARVKSGRTRSGQSAAHWAAGRGSRGRGDRLGGRPQRNAGRVLALLDLLPPLAAPCAGAAPTKQDEIWRCFLTGPHAGLLLGGHEGVEQLAA